MLSARARIHVRPIIIAAAYFVIAAATIATTRFGGGVAFIWLANALLVAELSRMGARESVPTVAACFVASCLATSLFGYGPPSAIPLGIINCGESMIGAA